MSVDQPIFIAAITIVAALYAAVGHGGASGYLALLAFTSMPHAQSSTLALCMNIVASSISFASFYRSKFLNFGLTWPFLVGSAPCAFLGGSLKLSGHVHQWILAVVLGLTALILIAGPPIPESKSEPKRWLMVTIGAVIGIVSGIVGVGGGIFLSPALILTGWANAKQAAATSALFILVNSLCGLAARLIGTISAALEFKPLLVAGCVGAIVGAALGSRLIPNPWLRRLLGVTLCVAVIKLVV